LTNLERARGSILLVLAALSLSAAPDAASIETADRALGSTPAARGGAVPVRLGQAGEDAVRGAYNIGDKVPVTIGGRTRIPDSLTPTTLSEVKNVGSLSYTRQLREYTQYAQQTGRTFDLYVRPGANLSGPLLDARAAGHLRIHDIPFP
jgi:hypothetical protein